MQSEMETASAALEGYFSRASSLSCAISSGAIVATVYFLPNDSAAHCTLTVSPFTANSYSLLAAQADDGNIMLDSSGACGWDSDDNASYEASW
ncbi:MAG: hypothetical protein ACI93R_000742 [Flavobacteriales bacterium]|jgi:hypothetical protein